MDINNIVGMHLNV